LLVSRNIGEFGRIFRKITDKKKTGLSKPDQDRIKEMAKGYIMKQYPMMSKMAEGSLHNGDGSKESKARRYQRVVKKYSNGKGLREKAEAIYRQSDESIIEAMGSGEEKNLLVVDMTALDKSKHGKFEHKQGVWSGAKKKSVLGYPLNAALMICRQREQAVPVRFEIVNRRSREYLSDNNEFFKMMEGIPAEIRKRCRTVLDRGYASSAIIKGLLVLEQEFVIRLQLNRDIELHGQKIPAKKIAGAYKNSKGAYLEPFDFRKPHYSRNSQVFMNYFPVKINQVKDSLHLVIFHTKGRKHPVLLITNSPIINYFQARQICKDYLSRWIIEDYFKFLKNKFNIERFKVRELNKIRFLLLIAYLANLAICLLDIICKLYVQSKSLFGYQRRKRSFTLYSVLDFLSFCFLRFPAFSPHAYSLSTAS
jgi:hypothetical protein